MKYLIIILSLFIFSCEKEAISESQSNFLEFETEQDFREFIRENGMCQENSCTDQKILIIQFVKNGSGYHLGVDLNDEERYNSCITFFKNKI